MMGLDGVIYAQAISDVLTTIITVPFALSVSKQLESKIIFSKNFKI